MLFREVSIPKLDLPSETAGILPDHIRHSVQLRSFPALVSATKLLRKTAQFSTSASRYQVNLIHHFPEKRPGRNRSRMTSTRPEMGRRV